MLCNECRKWKGNCLKEKQIEIRNHSGVYKPVCDYFDKLKKFEYNVIVEGKELKSTVRDFYKGFGRKIEEHYRVTATEQVINGNLITTGCVYRNGFLLQTCYLDECTEEACEQYWIDYVNSEKIEYRILQLQRKLDIIKNDDAMLSLYEDKINKKIYELRRKLKNDRQQ